MKRINRHPWIGPKILEKVFIPKYTLKGTVMKTIHRSVIPSKMAINLNRPKDVVKYFDMAIMF
jgi:hypothetical protein